MVGYEASSGLGWALEVWGGCLAGKVLQGGYDLWVQGLGGVPEGRRHAAACLLRSSCTAGRVRLMAAASGWALNKHVACSMFVLGGAAGATGGCGYRDGGRACGPGA